MIYYLKGRLAEVGSDFVILECNGVGYQVFVPDTFQHQLPELGSETKLFTFHYIREDQESLFGFPSVSDRQFFILLTSVSGVGPKMGVKILSGMGTETLTRAILEENIATLTQISGLGKKLAERLIVELKDKLSKLYTLSDSLKEAVNPKSNTLIIEDITMALKALGYKPHEIKSAISKASDVLHDGMALEDGIKILLKYL